MAPLNAKTKVYFNYQQLPKGKLKYHCKIKNWCNLNKQQQNLKNSSNKVGPTVEPRGTSDVLLSM